MSFFLMMTLCMHLCLGLFQENGLYTASVARGVDIHDLFELHVYYPICQQTTDLLSETRTVYITPIGLEQSRFPS